MIKWFFIYKWLELKEFFQEHWIPVSIIATTLVFGLVWHTILQKINQTPFQIACLSVLLGVVTMMVLAFCLAIVSWLKRIVKDNIEKAKVAVSYNASDLECDQCSGDIKIIPPRHSRQNPRFKCLDCGFVSDGYDAGARNERSSLQCPIEKEKKHENNNS